MADAIFDIALDKRFTDSQELLLVDVSASDVLLIHDSTSGLVYRIQAGTLASFINSAISSSDILDAMNLKANKSQEAWKVPVFAGAWANFATTGYEQAGFLKDELGFVCLRGLVRSGSGLIFTLPVGYRPAEQKIFAINASGSFGDLRINQDGSVVLNSGSNTYVSLAGVRFQAAANTYETGLTAEYDMITFSSAAVLTDIAGNGYNATFNATPTKIAAGLQFGSGGGFRASFDFVDGEIAYISLYNKVLSTDERNAAKSFIQGKMGGRSITV